MKKTNQRILCMLCTIISVLAFGTAAFAAGGARDIDIVHFYTDNEGNMEYRMVEHSVSTASPTQLSTLTRPVLGLSSGDMEYNVVGFRLDIYYENGDYEVREWTGAEVATASFQFQGPSEVRVYEAGMEYDNPQSYTAPRTSSGSGSSGGSGGRSNYLGYIGVFGLPQESVETGSTVKLTTNPSDTSVQYDEAALSLERLENGDYRFTLLQDGTHSITFSAKGYSDRTVKITGRTTASLTVQDNEAYNPNTGGYPDGGIGASDNPNTGVSRNVWAVLLLGSLSASMMVIFRQRTHRREG